MDNTARLRQIALLVSRQAQLATPELQSRFAALQIAAEDAGVWCSLMPVAFARAAYRFHFQGEYPLDQTRQQQGLAALENNTVYTSALAYACDCAAMDYLDTDIFNAIVRMSPEFTALRTAQ